MKEYLLQCEICGKDLELMNGYFACFDVEAATWQFVCSDCPDLKYDFSVARFFGSPRETIDCLAHLQEKRWFKPDKFFEFMERLRASCSYGSSVNVIG